MSFEGKEKHNKKSSEGSNVLRAALFSGAILAGSAAATIEESVKVNSHLLAPAAISELQQETGASEADISKLESNPRVRAYLKQLLTQEIARSRNSKQ